MGLFSSGVLETMRSLFSRRSILSARRVKQDSLEASQAAAALNQTYLHFSMKGHGTLMGAVEISGKRIQYTEVYYGADKKFEISLTPYPGNYESLVLFNPKSPLDNLKLTAHNTSTNEDFSTKLTLNGMRNMFTAEIEDLTLGEYEILFGEVQEKPKLAVVA